MTLSIVSEICSRRGIIGPISLRAISIRFDARLAIGDRASNDSSGGQTAEHSGAISIVATAITALSTVVAVTAMSPTAAMMAILDRLRVCPNLAKPVVRHKRRSRGGLNRKEWRRAKPRCRKQRPEYSHRLTPLISEVKGQYSSHRSEHGVGLMYRVTRSRSKCLAPGGNDPRLDPLTHPGEERIAA